jgi:hypothetical protein
MLIRSNDIRIQHIYEALSISGDIYIDDAGIRRFTPRAPYVVGYEFCCESYEGKRSRGFGKPGRAASWTAWGIFIAHLYKIDPQARIGHYTDATNFIKLTTDDAKRRGEPAPWLNDRDLMIYA